MTRILSFFAIATVGLVLVGCQSAPTDGKGSGCVPTPSGRTSEQITVSRDVRSAPRVEIPEEIKVTRAERSVVVEGKGRVAHEGALVTFGYVAYNGTTAKEIDSVGYGNADLTQATVDDTSLVPGLMKSLLCAAVGERIVSVVPSADAFNEVGNQQYGIGVDDAVVFVVDVVAVAGEAADGQPQPPTPGMPLVELDGAGEPTVTIPEQAPPAGLQIAVLKEGEGAEVVEGATVTVEYVGVVWGTSYVFDSSWTRDDLVQLPTTNFISGFADAIVGQKVGSQVEVIIPPAFGYGQAGNASLGIDSTDTLVFVIDILAVL